MIAAVQPLVTVLVCALFATSAITRGRWGAKDRLELLLAGLTAGVVLFAVQRVTDWSERWLIGLWWLAVIVLAAATAAAVLRWSDLPWLRDPRHGIRRRGMFGASVLVLAVVTAVVA